MKFVFALSYPLLVSALAVHQPEKRQTTFTLPNIDVNAILSALGSTVGDLLAGPKVPVSSEKLTPEINSAAVREKFKWGPFKLNPSNGTHLGGLDPNSDSLFASVSGLCSECMLLSVMADVVNPDGTVADISNGLYTHHIFGLNAGGGLNPFQPQTQNQQSSQGAFGSLGLTPICPNGGGFPFPGGLSGGFPAGFPGLSGFSGFPGFPGASGASAPATPTTAGSSHSHGGKAKRQTPNLNPGGLSSPLLLIQGVDATATKYQAKETDLKSGHYVGKGSSLMLQVEVVNYENRPRDIYLTFDYEYLPNIKSRPTDYHQAQAGLINSSPCAGIVMEIPEDKPTKFTGTPWNVTADGYIMNVKPHIHDGGINITLTVNGETKCVSDAVYGNSGEGETTYQGEKWDTITSFTPCDKPIAVKVGDKVAMDTVYDPLQHRLRPHSKGTGVDMDSMGVAFIVFAQNP